jgi:hypothetical protein
VTLKSLPARGREHAGGHAGMKEEFVDGIVICEQSRTRHWRWLWYGLGHGAGIR